MQTGMTRMKAMKQEIPTPASIRKAYVEEYLKRRPDAEEFEFYEAISKRLRVYTLHNSKKAVTAD